MPAPMNPRGDAPIVAGARESRPACEWSCANVATLALPPARTAVHAFVMLAALTILAPRARAQEPDEARRQEMARRVLEAAQPGPEHARLASLAGEWDLRFSYWTSPTGDPIVGTGTAMNRVILGGRFLHSESVTQLGDRRSEGLTILGFDRRANRYTTLGLDTWGTYYVEAEGPWDDGSRAMVMYGEETDPISNRTERYTMITRITGPDEYVQEIVFRLPNGESFKAVEIRHTRRK